jgi:DNA-binding response OmpR family regulator
VTSKNFLSLLLIDDDAPSSQLVMEYLEKMGHEVDYARDGVTGLALIAEHHFDVVILDGKMPKMDGLDVCRKLRQELRSKVSVLMVSGRAALEDRVAGLEAGADDYLVKPYALAELAARLTALARRDRGHLRNELRVGDLEMDAVNGRVSRAGISLDLTPIGKQLLAILMRASPAVVTREDIETQIWGRHFPASDALRSHIYQLRLRVDTPFERPLLHTLPGIGFRLST